MKTFVLAALTLLLAACGNPPKPQPGKFDFLPGNWKVIDRIILIHINRNEAEQKEYEQQYADCLKSTYKIDTSGIYNTGVTCEFNGCRAPLTRFTTAKYPVIDDTYNSKRYPGSEISDKVVGKTLVRLLDENFHPDSLQLINTHAYIDGADTLQICVVDSNRIGLFFGSDLLLLSRK